MKALGVLSNKSKHLEVVPELISISRMNVQISIQATGKQSQ